MKERIEAFIRQPGDEADFEALALDLYRWQRAHNPDYDAFCADADPRGWPEIPAVPVGLFRDLDLTCFPADQAGAVFRTSGTTAGRRGVHRLRDTALYDLGAGLHARACVGELPRRGVALVPPDPDSSLGHMCRRIAPDLQFCWTEAGPDPAAAWAALRRARGPQFVPATAFALADLLARPQAPCPLPAGSVLMITGGYKGRVRVVGEEALAGAAAAAFPGVTLVGEYGMTELSSQLWANPLGAAFRPPPWMRVRAVEPGSGAPAGQGLLRFYDLANHWTVLAVETEDLGVVHPDGTVTLLGRLAGATPRGCSLSAEEAGLR